MATVKIRTDMILKNVEFEIKLNVYQQSEVVVRYSKDLKCLGHNVPHQEDK